MDREERTTERWRRRRGGEEEEEAKWSGEREKKRKKGAGGTVRYGKDQGRVRVRVRACEQRNRKVAPYDETRK